MRNSIGLDDVIETLSLKTLWLFWGWLDVRQRYRRSVLGPLWVTLTMGVSIFATGFVYAYLFKQDISHYLPYVATGFVLWSFISGYISEACLVFIQNEGFINNIKLPMLLYPARLLWRYLITFLHHLVVLAVVLFLFTHVTFFSIFAVFLGLVLVCANLFWMGVLCGLISVRLRDFPLLVTTIFQVMFLVTPVIWPASALGNRISIAMVNPFYHLMEVVRVPLLEGVTQTWVIHLLVCVSMGIIGTIVSLYVLSRWKRRIIFWL